MFSRHGRSHSEETHFAALKSMEIPFFFTSAASHLTFSYERRCVTSWEHEGTPDQTKTKLSSNSSWKIYRSVQARIYHSWKWKCANEIQLVNTPHDRRRCLQADDTSMGAIQLTRSHSREKLAHTHSQPGVEVTAILANKITWHGNADRDCFWFKL